jgi:predicted amidohydrolase YtcJ
VRAGGGRRRARARPRRGLRGPRPRRRPRAPAAARALAARAAAAPGRPALLLRVDGHAGWANAAALAAAGIGAGSPDPPGGRVARDARGAPSGLVVDAALERVLAAVPAAPPGEVDRALRLGLEAARRAGLTAVHDAGADPDLLAAYRRLAAAAALPLRVYAMLDGQCPLAELDARIGARGPAEQGRLTVRAVKLFADGALGSRGAALLEPYADDPSTAGLVLLAAGELRERLARIAAAGLQPAVHAIGDRACREVLAAYAGMPALRALRPRVEHLQLLAREDLPLLARSGAVASMQPVHATSDAPWIARRLGEGRLAGAYAWRSVLAAGAPLALGSDFPVEDPDPRAGLFAAEARTPAGADAPWTPGERLAREEALRGFTAGAAYAAFAEGRRGAVREGLDADLTLLGADLLALPVEELRRVPVVGTVVGGEVRAEG